VLITLSCKNEQADYSFFQEHQVISKDCTCNRLDLICTCKNKKKIYVYNVHEQEPPCITMCRELDRYPNNCECPNFELQTNKHMSFNELLNKFEQLIDSSRTMLREARENL
jgi:hypothetical protein